MPGAQLSTVSPLQRYEPTGVQALVQLPPLDELELIPLELDPLELELEPVFPPDVDDDSSPPQPSVTAPVAPTTRSNPTVLNVMLVSLVGGKLVRLFSECNTFVLPVTIFLK